MFGGGGVEQTWLWENASEKGICFDPRNISYGSLYAYGWLVEGIQPIRAQQLMLTWAIFITYNVTL